MTRKEIIEELENNYNGMDTLNYGIRYRNGDNRLKTIHWVMDNFSCSYGVASRLVDRCNSGYSTWN